MPQAINAQDGRVPILNAAGSAQEFVEPTYLPLLQGTATNEQQTAKDETKQSRRKGSTKVRTGCVTCRARRVKCGEEKPCCLRCQNLKVVCGGYVATSKSKRKQTTLAVTTRPIVPKVRSSPGIVQFLQELLPGTSFKDETEWRYFRHFCDEFAATMMGPFKTSLWQRSIPQASELQPFIRKAAVALGALSVSRSKAVDDGNASDGGKDVVCKHEAYAVTQYVKALQGMRDALSNEPHDNRQALLACMLVFCYESLMGNQASASIHASGGLDLISRLNPIRSKNGTAEVDKSSYIPSFTADEEDLYTAFSALDIQALHFIDTRSDASHHRIKARLSLEIEEMPPLFKDIQEAARYWHLILRRNCHFIIIARTEISAIRSSRYHSNTEEGEVDTHIGPGNNQWSAAWVEPLEVPEALVNELNHCRDDINRFEQAAKPIFSKHMAYASGDGYYMTLMVKIQIAMNIISLVYCFFPPPVVWDDYQSTFDAVIAIAPRLMPLVKGSSSKLLKNSLLFRTEIGMIPAVVLTASFCRTQPTRNRALELLVEMGEYREGIWDAGTVHALASWLSDLEDEGRDENGYIPPTRRLSFESADINIRKRKMTAKAWKFDTTGKPVELVEGTVKW